MNDVQIHCLYCLCYTFLFCKAFDFYKNRSVAMKIDHWKLDQCTAEL